MSKTPTTYATEELARRLGAQEAEVLTRRGYPTKVLDVRPVDRTSIYRDGQSLSEMHFIVVPSTRWEVIFTEDETE